MSLRRKQLGGNIDCRKIYRTFWHSSVGNGSLAVAGYTISVFNWERRFRVSLKSDRGRKDMVAVRHAIKIYTDGWKMTNGAGVRIYCPVLVIIHLFKLTDQCNMHIGQNIFG